MDPAAAMLDVARSKPGADGVRWVHGDATTLPPVRVDAAFMTGNVDAGVPHRRRLGRHLTAAQQVLRPGGWLVFETRVPERRAWEQWTPELTRITVDVPDIGMVAVVGGGHRRGGRPRHVPVDDRVQDDEVVESTSTLRFRDRPEVEASLVATGFGSPRSGTRPTARASSTSSLLVVLPARAAPNDGPNNAQTRGMRRR